MHTFYCQHIANSKAILSESDSKHAIKVLRLQPGVIVRIINGEGTEAFGEITLPHAKSCEVSLTSIKAHEKTHCEIIIALAPTKNNDRTEWFLEKATEIGITQFYPIISTNSERKKFNAERWHKIVLAAVKQSQRLWMPKIEAPILLKDFISLPKPKLSFIAHCEKENKNELSGVTDSNQDQLILIGPEGDFSTQEIKESLSKGFIPVSIGSNRLRTETAGVAACTLMKLK